MKYLFAAVYVLVLLTQLPHVWAAYASLEDPNFHLATWTAIGAAVAFELSTGVFTFRVVQGSKRRWTRIGLAFFIVGSAVANAYYYAWAPNVFDKLMPVFATLALPAALALFAEEFGAEVKRETAKAKREATQASAPMPLPVAADALPHWRCSVCGQSHASQQALAGHMKAHKNGRANEPIPMEVVEQGGNRDTLSS